MLDLAIALLVGINVGYVLHIVHDSWNDRGEEN